MGIEPKTADEPLQIAVTCYAGYRGEETPRTLWLDTNRIEVTEVLDRWLSPDHRYFKLRGSDRALYIIRHNIPADTWTLTFYKNESALAGISLPSTGNQTP